MFTKKLLAVSILSALTTIAFSEIITYMPNIHGFNQVDLASTGTVLLRQGNHDSIQVNIPRRLKPYMNIYKSNKVLHLSISDHPFELRTKPVYLITVKHLQGLRDRNSGQIKVQTPIHTHQMAITLNNSGFINIPNLMVDGSSSIYLHNSGHIHINQMNAYSTRLNLANSGRITIDHLRGHDISTYLRNSGQINLLGGRVNNETVQVRNSGHYNAKNLNAKNGSVVMRNSGHVSMTVHQNLNVMKRGSGELNVFGSPKIKEYDVRNATGLNIS